MTELIWGSLFRILQAFLQGSPFILSGICITAILQRMLGAADTKRLFGSNSIVSLFQSWCIGMALPGLMLTLTRQCFFLIPVVLILPRFIGLKGIWLSFPISDVMAAAVTFILLRRQYRAFEREPLPKLDPKPDPVAECR